MLCAVDVELSPPQPPEVEEAVAAALDQAPRAPDPWWEAGNRDALGT
jgi:hypothetical protein